MNLLERLTPSLCAKTETKNNRIADHVLLISQRISIQSRGNTSVPICIRLIFTECNNVDHHASVYLDFFNATPIFELVV